MNICTGWSLPVQVHIPPSSPITEHASVKVKDCCAKNLAAITSAEERSLKISVTWINFLGIIRS